MFKIGDTVRIIKDVAVECGLKKGDVAVVTSIGYFKNDRKDILYNLEGFRYDWGIRPDKLELAAIQPSNVIQFRRRDL